MKKAIPFCMICPCLFLLLSVAVAVGATDEIEQLDTVTVVGEASEVRDDLAIESLTNPYRVEASARVGSEVFSAEDIAAINPSDLFDLLNQAAGINMTYQGRRKQFIVSQRGGGSFTYIVDGAVLPSSADRILYNFPLSAIEQLQVVRGATALTLGPSIGVGASSSGSGLNTGYIIIRTKKPQKTEAILSATMEKSKGGHPVASSEDLYAGFHFGEASGINGYVGGMIANMDRPSQDSWFDGRDGRGGMVNTGLTAGKLSFNLMAHRDKGRLEFQRGVDTDGILSDAKWYYDPIETRLVTGDMEVRWSTDQVTMLSAFNVDYDQTEHDEYFSSSKSSIREYEEKTSGISLRHNARFGNTLVQLGGQLTNSEGQGANLYMGLSNYDTTVKGVSASVEQTCLTVPSSSMPGSATTRNISTIQSRSIRKR